MLRQFSCILRISLTYLKMTDTVVTIAGASTVPERQATVSTDDTVGVCGSNMAAASHGQEGLPDMDVDQAGSLSQKRLMEENPEAEGTVKKTKVEDEKDIRVSRHKKKKVALLLVYSGKGYMGMQRNPGCKTIESDLMDALVKAGVITEEQVEQPGARNPVEKINNNLPAQIQVLSIKRTTKGFDSKNACCARTYIYLLPTFAFTPIDQPILEDFRITDEILQQVKEILALYKGTHRFHNFTSGKKPDDPSARRYITEFSIGEPFVRDGHEYAIVAVKGQSFVLHQIRKMIGLTIAIVRGLSSKESVDRAWGPDRCDVPKAPGLGLVLDKVHYDQYNKRFGNDGIHEPIDWNQYKVEEEAPSASSGFKLLTFLYTIYNHGLTATPLCPSANRMPVEKIDKFKEDHIFSTIFSTEKTEKSMINWLASLHLHTFDIVLDGQVAHESVAGKAMARLQAERRRNDDEETPTELQDVLAVDESDKDRQATADPHTEEATATPADNKTDLT